MQDLLVECEGLTVLESGLYGGTKQLAIVGVRTLDDVFEVVRVISRLESVDAPQVVRPLRHVRNHIPLPAAETTDHLRLDELAAVALEQLHHVFALGDVTGDFGE